MGVWRDEPTNVQLESWRCSSLGYSTSSTTVLNYWIHLGYTYLILISRLRLNIYAWSHQLKSFISSTTGLHLSTTVFILSTTRLHLIHYHFYFSTTRLHLIHYQAASHPLPGCISSLPGCISSTSRLYLIHYQAISYPLPGYISSTSRLSLIHF